MAMVKEKEDDPILTPTKPLLSISPSFQSQELESDNKCFSQSLKELEELRFQLYHAADYCESGLLKTAEKKILLGNTKKYVCEAIVTVVDHLGTASANLEQRIHGNIKLSQTEQRIDCLKQRFLTCQYYALGLEISSLQWRAKFPRHHQHYVSPSAQQLTRTNDILKYRDVSVSAADTYVPDTSPCKKNQLTIVADQSTSVAHAIMKPRLTNLFPGIELRTVKPCKSLFGSPTKDASKLGDSDQKKTPLQRSNFLSFLKTSKRRR